MTIQNKDRPIALDKDKQLEKLLKLYADVVGLEAPAVEEVSQAPAETIEPIVEEQPTNADIIAETPAPSVAMPEEAALTVEASKPNVFDLPTVEEVATPATDLPVEETAPTAEVNEPNIFDGLEDTAPAAPAEPSVEEATSVVTEEKEETPQMDMPEQVRKSAEPIPDYVINEIKAIYSASTDLIVQAANLQEKLEDLVKSLGYDLQTVLDNNKKPSDDLPIEEPTPGEVANIFDTSTDEKTLTLS